MRSDAYHLFVYNFINGYTDMKHKALLGIAVALALAGPVAALANDADADRSHPGAFIKDSAITAKIKTKLAAEHLTSLGRIKVDTDANGIVWLGGTARSQEAIDKAVSIARSTEHVKEVKNHITVKMDD